jgi:hypothetical protein
MGLTSVFKGLSHKLHGAEILLEKLKFLNWLRNPPLFYGTPFFVTVTKNHHLFLEPVKSI